MGIIIKDGVRYSGSSGKASSTKYDNTTSGLKATNVQGAIDEINSNLSQLGEKYVFEETQIGTYLEKPLYRKGFVVPSGTINYGSGYTIDSSFTSAYCDIVVNIHGYAEYGTNGKYPCTNDVITTVVHPEQGLYMYKVNSGSMQITEGIVFVEYTKP